MAEHPDIDAGGQTIAVRKDLRVPMRDGVELAADAYQGVEDKPRPALVALSPYGKELQALALTTPPQRRPSPMWDGCIEAGDIARVVEPRTTSTSSATCAAPGAPAASTSATTTPAASRWARTPTTSSSGSPRSRGATAMSA